jgi:transposase
MPRYLGLDLHKDYVHGCEWFVEDQKERHFHFANSETGWSKFIFEELDQNCIVAAEVTGNAFEIYDLLLPHVNQIILANPVELKRYGSGRHTDLVDAAMLAKMLALGTLKSVWVPPLNVRDVRRLIQYRHKLAVQLHRSVNQAKAVLRRNGCQIPKQVDPRLYTDSADIKKLPGADQAILISSLRQVDSTKEEIKAIEAELAKRAIEIKEIKNLMTITGVGLITASVIWSSIGDASRFSNRKQITRYAGLDPSVHQSGEEYYHGHISKNGNHLLRSTLIEASNAVARFDNGSLGLFFRRKSITMGRKKAIVALARKVLIVAWRMLLSDDNYIDIKDKTFKRKEQDLKSIATKSVDWTELLSETWAFGKDQSSNNLKGISLLKDSA